MAMLTTAFDAGGHETDPSCLVVAGYIATADVWMAFDTAWRARLKQDGLTYFHMVDFAHWTGPFANRAYWTEARRRALITDLIEIIGAHAFRKFGCGVIGKTYDRISSDLRDRFRLSRFVVAARTCIADVRRWAATADGFKATPIEWVFEDGELGKGKLMGWMKAEGLPAPAFKPKRDGEVDGVPVPAFTPLQAADILAYELYVALKRNEAGQMDADNLRHTFKEIERHPPGRLGVVEEDNLEVLEQGLTILQDDPRWREAKGWESG